MRIGWTRSRRGWFRGAATLIGAAAAVWAYQQGSDFAGTWVFRQNGGNIFKLTLAVEGTAVTGSLTRPEEVTMDSDGNFSAISEAQETLPIEKGRLGAGRLELTIDGDHYVLTLEDSGKALLATEGLHPWKLERAPAGSTVVLATSLPQREYPAEIRALREELRGMVKEDQDARMAFDYARMEAVDAKDRAEVLRIFAKYGWVTRSLAGSDAAHDFWLLVQHQTPEIMQRLLPAMEKAANAGDASMSDYAYLFDRVQMSLGKPQHWGTQARCKNGKPVLYPVDDPAGLEARRKALFLMPMDDYLKLDYLVRFCATSPK